MNFVAPESTLTIGALIALIIGLVVCFSGARFFKLALILVGGFIGLLIGAAIASQTTDSTMALVLGGLIGLLAGFVFAYPLFSLAALVAGAAIGLTLAVTAASALSLQGGILILVLLLGALVGGVLALALRETLIMIGTAFQGAAMAATGLAALLPINRVAEPAAGMVHYQLDATWATIVPVITVVLGIVGAIVQFSSRRPVRR